MNAPKESISLHCIVESAPLEMFIDALLIGAFRSQRKVLFWHLDIMGWNRFLKENNPYQLALKTAYFYQKKTFVFFSLLC